MNANFQTKSIIVYGALLLVLIVSGYTLLSDDNDITPIFNDYNKTPSAAISEIPKANSPIASTNLLNNTDSINFESLPNKHNTNKAKSLQTVSEEAVYKALHRIKLDNNNVIIDHETLIALNEILDDNRLKLDNQAIEELQILVKKGLPGIAGEQVAEILKDYYQYLEAAQKFNTAYEVNSDPSLGFEKTTEEHETNYRVLMSLRELYLDADVVSNLFSTYDANANYMFDILKVEQNDNLSDEEKQQMRNEIRQRHTKHSINVDNWNDRHLDFLAAKQNILSSSISDKEKQAQLTELMHQHFSQEELDYVKHFQLDKP